MECSIVTCLEKAVAHPICCGKCKRPVCTRHLQDWKCLSAERKTENAKKEKLNEDTGLNSLESFIQQKDLGPQTTKAINLKFKELSIETLNSLAAIDIEKVPIYFSGESLHIQNLVVQFISEIRKTRVDEEEALKVKADLVFSIDREVLNLEKFDLLKDELGSGYVCGGFKDLIHYCADILIIENPKRTFSHRDYMAVVRTLHAEFGTLFKISKTVRKFTEALADRVDNVKRSGGTPRKLKKNMGNRTTRKKKALRLDESVTTQSSNHQSSFAQESSFNDSVNPRHSTPQKNCGEKDLENPGDISIDVALDMLSNKKKKSTIMSDEEGKAEETIVKGGKKNRRLRGG